MTRVFKPFRAILIVIVASATFVAPASAAPCWQQVIDDWFQDSRVDGTYPVNCYRLALTNLPEDMRSYSSAPDDIARALRDALQRQGSRPAGSQSDEGESGAVGGGSPGNGGSSGPSGGQGTGGEPGFGPDAEAPATGPINEAIDRIGPNDPASVPLPLIVLGAIALLLLAAGGAGLLARHLNGPKPRPGPR